LISRPWTTDSTKAARDFANSLYGVVSQFMTEEGRACTIAAYDLSALMGYKVVKTVCGQKSIEIKIYQPSEGVPDAVVIQETCFARK